MADLTEKQKEDYWRYNIKLTTILLVIWFVVTYIISGLMAGWLNQYALLMNRLDLKYGIREEG